MRDVQRFAELRLNVLFGVTPVLGNVVRVYHGQNPASPRLMASSHFGTVRNGGKYDGRLSILVPMACVRELSRQGKRLPFGSEVVGFSEEEGQRHKAVFLGSGASTGAINNARIDQTDTQRINMRQAMADAGLNIDDIPSLKRDPAKYLDFVKVHIEQGPVLSSQDFRLRECSHNRKTWLFAGSLRAGERAAAVMTLVQSAKLNGHDPYAYLKDILTRMPTHPNSRIDELLPHNWKPEVQEPVDEPAKDPAPLTHLQHAAG